MGRSFAGAEVFWDRTVDRPPADEFRAALRGRRVTRAGRRGKYLVFHLDGGGALVVHLRMTGRLRLRETGAERDRHLRAVLHLDDGRELHFEDQRKFGRLYLVPDGAGLNGVLAKIGPEPLAGAFTRGQLRQLLARRRTALKPLLLDQRFLAGLGNIYVDESLYRARLHPLRRSDSLTEAEITALHAGIVDALQQGITNRGTTLSDYRDAWGDAGLTSSSRRGA